MKRTTALAAVIVATTALLIPGVPPSHAATTYTPTGGPIVRFVGTSVSFTDIEVSQTFGCTTSKMAGSVSSSGTSRAYHADGATLGTLEFLGCTNAQAGATAIAPSGTWTLAIIGDPVGQTWPARLKNVSFGMLMTNCGFMVQGSIGGRFNQYTQQFIPNTGPSGLTVLGGSHPPLGSMCATLDIQPGDSIAVGGYWTNSPPSGSTALLISNP
ncbi:hypothetical protein ABFU82_18985 [Nocardioides sp. WV_118_6]